ncbi:MAG TPA: 50S ribosomal protein L11 methyltransferase [Longimicrobiaceae bacterium]|nr:50S ribosomal protein L11 methyltransferase [Longimicrobiaceae bacterium]
MTASDRWLVLTARAPTVDAAALLAEGLVALGGGAVVETADGLVTYLTPPHDPEAFVAEARARLAEGLPDGAEPELTWRWQESEDWARKWKEGLRPRRVTPRVVVKPTWTEWDAAPGETVIDIDPQMAFGTGEHATTRGCLRLLDGALRPGDRVLDVGSGSAILAIAAARLGAGETVAVEYDPDANLNARENLELNGVEGRVRIVEAMADPALLRGLGRFDLLLANILSSVIRPLLPGFREALGGSPEGRLIVSGILRAEHADVARDAEAAGFRVARTDEEEEWWSALLVPAASS